MKNNQKWESFDMNFSIGTVLLDGIFDALLGQGVGSEILKDLLGSLKLLIDGILGLLITALGINLSQVDVGVQMNCGFQPSLVY